MNEQLLKDLVATAQHYNYDWDIISSKFPELDQYDTQLLKDYVATAESRNYDYNTVNNKFPEFNLGEPTDDEVDENWFGQTWFGRGFEAASTTGEATDLFMEGSNVNMETIQEFIKAKEQEAKEHVPSERMQKFQKQYQKEGKTWAAFFRGIKRDPTLMAELFVQSLGTQIGTAFDAPEARATALAGGATGAGIGFAAGGIGAIPGAFAGAMGGLAVTMETALTFGELIETELHKQNKEFTDENIKELLEGPMGKTIRNRALGRGLSIGAIEGLSGGLAGKAAVATKGAVQAARGGRVGKRGLLAASAAGVGVEAAGGGIGEVAGRAAAAQEMDPAEIGFEAITGTVTAPGNVGLALLRHKAPKYYINNMKKEVTYDEISDFIETADPIDIAKANIKIENNLVLERKAWDKQQRGILDSQIDAKITDQKDRDDLVEWEIKRKLKEVEAEKKGIDRVPNAGEELAIIEAEIDAIMDKYEGAVSFGETAIAKEVADVVAERRYKAGMEFAKKHASLYGLEFDDTMDTQQLAKYIQDNNIDPNAINSDGFVHNGKIIINKAVAKNQKNINVGNHELLHGILRKAVIEGKINKNLISDLKTKVGKDWSFVEDRIDKHYSGLTGFVTEEQAGLYGLDKSKLSFNKKNAKGEAAAEVSYMEANPDEYLTLLSDAISDGDVTFNEGRFDGIKDLITPILRAFGFKKIKFDTADQVYDFLKEYNKSIHKGTLSAGITKATAGKVEGTGLKMSRTTPRAQQFLDAEIDNKSLVDIINSPQSTQEDRFAAGEAVLEKNWPIISKALKFDPAGAISMQAVKDAVYEQFLGFTPKEGIILPDGTKITRKTSLFKTYNKEREVTTFLDATLRNRQPEIFTRAKVLDQIKEGVDISKAKNVKAPETTKQKPSKKVRKIKSLSDITIDNKDVISQTIYNKVVNIIEQNPKNLTKQLNAL